MSEFDIKDVPRTFQINGESFTEANVKYLKSYFPEMDMAHFDKKKLRKDLVVQKAIRSGVVLCNAAQTDGHTAILSLTQTGRVLLGKI